MQKTHAGIKVQHTYPCMCVCAERIETHPLGRSARLALRLRGESGSANLCEINAQNQINKPKPKKHKKMCPYQMKGSDRFLGFFSFVLVLVLFWLVFAEGGPKKTCPLTLVKTKFDTMLYPDTSTPPYPSTTNCFDYPSV